MKLCRRRWLAKYRQVEWRLYRVAEHRLGKRERFLWGARVLCVMCGLWDVRRSHNVDEIARNDISRLNVTAVTAAAAAGKHHVMARHSIRSSAPPEDARESSDFIDYKREGQRKQKGI